MHDRVVLSEAAWAAVRAAYEGRTETVSQILARFGIQKHNLYYRADRDGWRKRTEYAVRDVEDVPPPPAVAALMAAPVAVPMPAQTEEIVAAPFDIERPPETHAQRLERLHRIIDRLLMKLERTMANNPNMSPQDQEKTARAVTQTVAAMERVAELDTTRGQVPETDGGQSHERVEADRMRREIAERLERLSARFSDGPAQPE